uniref:Protein-S-isoprenylcysteine O-methyltransferase n=1 Tax=Kalanchoe fedtschenkoi TaxID=63787 RepID=A0A7N0UMN7_KALFE
MDSTTTTSGFLHSGTTSLLGFGRIECSSKQPPSIRHFPKQLPGCLAISNSLRPRRHALLKSCFGKPTRPLKSSFSIAATSGTQDLPLLEKVKAFSFDSLKESSLGLTPFDVCKWAGIISVAIAATKWLVGLLFNPFFWMYFSWTWMYWPSLSALTIGIYGSFCLRKHYIGQASIFEQLAIATSAITWLTLVPPGFLNGFLEGWPLVFFLVYHYFFFLNVTVRKRQYGDYYARKHDPKWDVRLPTWCQSVFFGAVMVGHWLAAMEGPELHMIPGGWWINSGIWLLIMFVIFTHYYATVFLAKYVDNTAEPTAVVQFGPYRSVRHPLYASTMLLFVSYFVALRAPLSMLYVIAVCLTYYGQKAKLEEHLMLEAFGDRYTEYMNKVKFKFIPFIY